MARLPIKGPLLSVFVLAYNHDRFIKKAIEGVLMQKTDFDFEIVVGEDCSTDRTREILSDYSEKFPEKFKLLLNAKNLGAKINQAIVLEACKGEYIALCEGDDYWILQDKLQRQKDFLDANPDFSMCFTDRRLIDYDDNILNKSSIPENRKRHLEAADIIGGFTPPTQTVVFRKSSLGDMDSFLEKYKTVYNGDIFLFSFLSTRGKVGYIDMISAAYRINENGVYGGLDFTNRLYNRLNTLRVLRKIIPAEHRKLVFKSLKVILQRLFVINFKRHHFIRAARNIFSLILLDIKTLDVSVLRAILLLIKCNLYKDFIITD